MVKGVMTSVVQIEFLLYVLGFFCEDVTQPFLLRFINILRCGLYSRCQ
jgi:hypothetical protein